MRFESPVFQAVAAESFVLGTKGVSIAISLERWAYEGVMQELERGSST